jgi:hypothetical protein
LDLNGLSYKFIIHNKSENSYKDLILMAACKHFIIANSTFSWWAAWLGEKKLQNQIIISPKIISKTGLCGWGFEGLIPHRWLQI